MLSNAENEYESAIKIYPEYESAQKKLIAIEINRGENEKANILMSHLNIQPDSNSANIYFDLANDGVKK